MSKAEKDSHYARSLLPVGDLRAEREEERLRRYTVAGGERVARLEINILYADDVATHGLMREDSREQHVPPAGGQYVR